MTPPQARDLATLVPPVSPQTSCGAVFDRLLAEPETQNIPVTRDGRPVGLIGRQGFLQQYARPYGPELYSRTSIARLMERDLVTVEGSMSCEMIDVRSQDGYGNPVLRPFIVTEGGLYGGMGDTTRLMLAMADLATARAAALQEETRRAEAASRSKTQFLAGMSHELRTPLNAIIGFADLMRLRTFGELQPARYGEYVDDIHRSGLHLLNMINELLDMAKIESGHVELRETTFHPLDIGVDILRMLRQSIADAQLSLRVDMADDLPFIHADQQHIRRILINLLSNAIKYTLPEGCITLAVCVCGPDEAACGEEGLKVTVEDTGIGIPPDMLQKVMEPFEQVENSFTRTRAGTGLGLPLTKAMVEAHGGRFWLESELGRGTRAHALLPASRIVWDRPLRRKMAQRGASPV